MIFIVATPAGLAGAQASQPAAQWAEMPFWPIGLKISADMGGKDGTAKSPAKADILVWLPPGAEHIRAMLLIPNNSDSKDFGQHEKLRAVAAKHEMAIVYLRNFNTGIEPMEGEPDTTRIQPMLDLLAKETKIAEFRYAPWITYGKSSRGKFPFRMAWLWPERTIATVSFHAETPSWPVPPWAKLNGETILHVNANGQTEWGGTWCNHVRPSLLNYRSQKGWLAHTTVSRDVGHGDYVDANGSEGWGKLFPEKVTVIDVWDYLSMFVDKALTLRLPHDEYPADHPLKLKQIDESTGYLIDPFAVEEMFKVPHLPLKKGEDGLYKVGAAEEAPVSGYREMTPLADGVPAGAPVVPLEIGKSPSNWLITDSVKFAMKADPMLDLGDWKDLAPKIGDALDLDGTKVKWRAIAPKEIPPTGGIALDKGLRSPNKPVTLAAFTVLDVS